MNDAAAHGALRADIIRENLSPALRGLELITLERADSTNSLARSLAREARGEFAVLAATQTAGRGTKGRAFFSPDGTGLYMSALLRPEAETGDALMLTAAAAVCVCEAAEEMSCAPLGVKWVNDIILCGKKVCGILAETSLNASGALEYAIVGIGVNITPPRGGFPAEVEGMAGAIFKTPPPFAREKLAAGILSRLLPFAARLGEGAFVEEYRRRSVLTDKEVNVITPRGARRATALGIDERCRLLVRYEDGSREALNAAEVSVRL